jgi:hypothetical protein
MPKKLLGQQRQSSNLSEKNFKINFFRVPILPRCDEKFAKVLEGN